VTNNGTMFTSFNGGSGGNTLVINGTLTNNANAFFNEGFVLYGPGDSATIGSVTNTATGFVDLENASTLTVKGDVNNSGFLSTGYFYGTGSTLNINGTLNNYSGATFGVLRSGDIANVSELNNSGGVYVGLGATLNVSGTLTNNSGGSVELYGAGLGSMATIGSVVNAGSLDLENVATLTVQGDVSNSGTISTSGPGGTPGNTLTISGTLTNSGSFTANGPSDTIMIGSEVNSTFNSSFDLENGSTLTVAASGKGAQLRRERLGHYSRSGQTPTFFSLGPR